MFNYNKSKYPITDEQMDLYLDKYPFLNFTDINGNLTIHDSVERRHANYYALWDGTGWEELWKKYLTKLFSLYDSWDENKKKVFKFTDVKEKYGGLRIYTTFDTGLENIAELLSEWVCAECGKISREDGKRVIWTTSGWIMNLCEDCLIERGFCSSILAKKFKHIQEKPFGYKKYDKNFIKTVIYKDTDDNWLEIDSETEEKRG